MAVSRSAAAGYTPLRTAALDKLWAPSEVTYLVELLREVYSPLSQTSTREAAYYVTNSASPALHPAHLQ